MLSVALHYNYIRVIQGGVISMTAKTLYTLYTAYKTAKIGNRNKMNVKKYFWRKTAIILLQ